MIHTILRRRLCAILVRAVHGGVLFVLRGGAQREICITTEVCSTANSHDRLHHRFRVGCRLLAAGRVDYDRWFIWLGE